MYKYSQQRPRKVLSIIILLMLAALLTPTLTVAQEDCLKCHADAGTSVKDSVHRFMECTSCHRDIEGFPHQEGAYLTKKESAEVCASCHVGRIAESYQESFHGKAVFLGSQNSATCSDCHGAHYIPRWDSPESPVADENVAQTCASCHGQAAPGFAEGDDHFILSPVGAGAPMYYTAKFFIWLTIIVLVGMVIHIELQLYRHLRNILDERKRR